MGKDTLHDYLAHLEDAFLVRTLAMHSASERQRMVNPRKAYTLADRGEGLLISAIAHNEVPRLRAFLGRQRPG